MRITTSISGCPICACATFREYRHLGSTATLTMVWRNSWSITGQTHEKLTLICQFEVQQVHDPTRTPLQRTKGTQVPPWQSTLCSFSSRKCLPCLAHARPRHNSFILKKISQTVNKTMKKIVCFIYFTRFPPRSWRNSKIHLSSGMNWYIQSVFTDLTITASRSQNAGKTISLHRLIQNVVLKYFPGN